MQNLVFGILWGILGQIVSFFQLQVGIKYGWNQKHPMLLLLLSLPISWTFLKSVEYLIKAFDGQTWPNRLIGQSIGIIMFSIMSWLVFRETITMKTGVCIILALCIVAIQIFWKT
jgi:hypothetical protein